MDYYNEDYLIHYGVKGMKWGVRRYQKKDGSLTPAGKKRYSEDKSDSASVSNKTNLKKISHRDILEKKYRDSGMTESEAKEAANKRIKVEKAIAITAGVTVAACAAYYAKNKWTETYCDQILKSGTTFHNLDSVANPRPGEHLYVNYRQNDTNYFRGHFAINKMKKTGQVFNHTLTANEDIKIPSLNTRKNVFKQLYENDSEFRSAFSRHSNALSSSSADSVYKKMWQKFGDKDNEEFNVAKHKYFEALRQKGYEAIVDEWDTNPAVFRSDAPLILLNTSSKSFGEMTIKELTDKDILLAQADSRHYRSVRDFKTVLGVPHTNHFKESNSSLTKSAAKTARNVKNIETYLNSVSKKESGISIRDDVLKRNGKIYADAGKYMNKYSMDASEARSKAERKALLGDAAQGLGLVGGMLGLPYAVLTKTNQTKRIKKHLQEHPDTKLTYEQIKNATKYNKQVREYIEEHPNSKLTYAQILKLYYRLDNKRLA